MYVGGGGGCMGVRCVGLCEIRRHLKCLRRPDDVE